MDIKSIVSHIGPLATAVASLVPGGGAAVAAANAVKDLIDDVRDTAKLDAADTATLESSRDELEKAVNAHADRTAAALGD